MTSKTVWGKIGTGLTILGSVINLASGLVEKRNSEILMQEMVTKEVTRQTLTAQEDLHKKLMEQMSKRA